MKISKGHYVPKELITSEAVHEAVVKCFVAAGFQRNSDYVNYREKEHWDCIAISGSGVICWSDKQEKPLTLQQLFTAENGISWPDWAVDIRLRRDNQDCIFTDGKYRFMLISKQDDIGAGSKVVSGSKILAIRQPKENEAKTIEDAVIAKSGKWNSSKAYIQWCGDAWMFHDVNELWQRTDEYPYFYHGEFEARAKRLGYINGYRWGVEYPTNGKRPDLEDDVLVNVCDLSGDWVNYGCVSKSFWPISVSFRITDQRFKPANTSYLNALTQPQSLTHSEEGLTHSEWWDYENDCLISQPPVGETVLMSPKYDDKSHATVVGGYEYDVVFYSHRTGTYFGDRADRLNVKPLDHATRKAGLEREKVIEAAIKIDGSITKNQAESLYNAGMLVLPPKKSDTED